MRAPDDEIVTGVEIPSGDRRAVDLDLASVETREHELASDRRQPCVDRRDLPPPHLDVDTTASAEQEVAIDPLSPVRAAQPEHGLRSLEHDEVGFGDLRLLLLFLDLASPSWRTAM